MKPSWLIWQITWRSALRIMLLGALFGGIYGPSVVIVVLAGEVMQRGASSIFNSPLQEFLGIMLFAAVVGAFIAAALGFAIGILLGLLISAITIRAFLPLHDVPRYLRVVQLSSTIAGGIGALVGTPLVSRLLFGATDVTEDMVMLAMFSVVPALLACVAIWRGSRQIAAWYVRTAGAA